MAERELKSLVFKLNDSSDAWTIDFFHFDMDVLREITRILDIEGYKKSLTIKVNTELYREVQELLVSNYWLINLADHIDADGYNILINGFELIFKREQHDIG